MMKKEFQIRTLDFSDSEEFLTNLSHGKEDDNTSEDIKEAS